MTSRPLRHQTSGDWLAGARRGRTQAPGRLDPAVLRLRAVHRRGGGPAARHAGAAAGGAGPGAAGRRDGRGRGGWPSFATWRRSRRCCCWRRRGRPRCCTGRWCRCVRRWRCDCPRRCSSRNACAASPIRPPSSCLPAEPELLPEAPDLPPAALALVKLARLLPAVLAAPLARRRRARAAELNLLAVAADDVLAYPQSMAAELTRVAEAQVPLADAPESAHRGVPPAAMAGWSTSRS